MSDLLQLEEKVLAGDEWRDTTTIPYNGDEHEIKYRILGETEMAHAMNIIGEDNFEEKVDQFQSIVSQIGEDDREEVQELKSKVESDPDGLTDEEQDRLEELTEQVSDDDDVSALALYEKDFVEGCHYAFKQGVEPDKEDVDAIRDMTAEEQRDRFGEMLMDKEDAEEAAQDIIETIAMKSKGWKAFEVGLMVLFKSLGGAKN